MSCIRESFGLRRSASIHPLMIVFILLVSGLISTPPCRAISPDNATASVSLEIQFDPETLEITALDGLHWLNLPNGDLLAESGKPALPVRILRLALPPEMIVTDVQADILREITLPGRYRIAPAAPPLPVSDEPPSSRGLEPDPEVYGSFAAFPHERAVLLQQCDLAGQNIAIVEVRPLRYYPADEILRLATSLKITLNGVPGQILGDYLPANASTQSRARYRQQIADWVVNPEDVSLHTAPASSDGPRGVAPGHYDYVIITRDEWMDEFLPLADWRSKSGLHAAIVSAEWINDNGGYVGSTLEKIRAFVADAHQTWGAANFLLAADVDVIPCHIRRITIPNLETADIPNDTYYADYDEDWICEVNVGRFSAQNESQIAVFLAKLFTYEKNPPRNDYVKTAAFFGFDISQPDDGHGEYSKNLIRQRYLPASWALETEYDSEPGTHHDDVIGYLQQGHHLVNHHDHCHYYCMGTGWISHQQVMDMSEVAALTNGRRLSLVFAIGCYPTDVTYPVCIGDVFLFNPYGGGVSFIGNSRTGWSGAEPYPINFSLLQDHYFYRNLLQDGIRRIGDNFTDLKNDAFNPNDPENSHKYCFTQLFLLGDPGMPVWSDEPRELSAIHESVLAVDQTTTFTVQVFENGNPLDDAAVCLWKSDELFQQAQTVAGAASFVISPERAGHLFVTVYKANYIPYEGLTLVGLIGDLNNDGQVNLSDLAQLLGNYGGRGHYDDGDMDGDGDIDLSDLAALLSVYGSTR